MSETNRKFLFKITIIGDGQVGKTSLIKKFTKGSFRKDYIKTIGAQFSIHKDEIDGDIIQLLLWDIAGQDDFNFLRASFFKNSNASIIVYSLEPNKLGEESFSHIQDWDKDIKKYCGDIPRVIFANKVDLIKEEEIPHDVLKQLVEKNKYLAYYITSAKTGQGVIEAFNTLVRTLYEKYTTLSQEVE
ncbi:MAG: GTP-binding protein [Candidatus Lokiarchaeota archaeon]|nr:GTP-binding protein [Candidatus Lokiarchaeota archaeon]